MASTHMYCERTHSTLAIFSLKSTSCLRNVPAPPLPYGPCLRSCPSFRCLEDSATWKAGGNRAGMVSGACTGKIQRQKWTDVLQYCSSRSTYRWSIWRVWHDTSSFGQMIVDIAVGMYGCLELCFQHGRSVSRRQLDLTVALACFLPRSAPTGTGTWS